MAVSTGACTGVSFSPPSIPNIEFYSVQASLVTNYSTPILEGWRYSQPSLPVENATFCNVTVTYTHTGQNDSVGVETWLPVQDYNGKLQSIGGGGWTAGRFILSYAGMLGAISDGYATVSTDAGVGDASFMDWVVRSPGVADLNGFQNLGSLSLYEEASIAKHFIYQFYGSPPDYSYWNGCSQGGRQGSMLAQRFPGAYDGIIAAAPAVNWAEVVLNSMWPGFYMELTNQYPNACQLNKLTKLVISECDKDNGVEDGIISDPNSCMTKFFPEKYIGTEFVCSQYNSTQIITSSTVDVARAIWNGPVSSSGERLWYGFNVGTDLTTMSPTNCDNSGECFENPVSFIAEIDKYFIIKDPTVNLTGKRYSHKDFENIYYSFKSQFDSFIATNDANYTAFKEAGGKIITFHGLADEAIVSNGTVHLYDRIADIVPDIHSFYRYFEVPGLAHCFGGTGGQPVTSFDRLRAWVENGTAPESLTSTVTKPDNTTYDQLLCPYPQKASYHCSNQTLVPSDCWSCVA